MHVFRPQDDIFVGVAEVSGGSVCHTIPRAERQTVGGQQAAGEAALPHRCHVDFTPVVLVSVYRQTRQLL